MAPRNFLGVLDLNQAKERMPHFWVFENEDEKLVSRRTLFIQIKCGTIISGAAIESEDAFKLDARFLPELKRLKFRLSKWTQYPAKWNEFPINADNTIMFGMPHYLNNIEPEHVEYKIRCYFAEFEQHVSYGKNPRNTMIENDTKQNPS